MGLLPQWLTLRFTESVLLLFCVQWITSHSQGFSKPDFTNFHFNIEPSDALGYKGSSLYLNCSVTSPHDINPTIHWMKDNVPIDITSSKRHTLLDNGSLLISEVTNKKQDTDAGVYQCVAMAKGHTIISRKAHVQIAGIERNFNIDPSDLEVFLTDTAMFQCQINSLPSANITWYKDGKPLSGRTSMTKYRTYPEGVLEIYNVAFADLGDYSCEAQGIDKTRTSREATLKQKNAEEGFQGIEPRFTLKPQDTSGLVGSKVILFCGAYGLGSEMTPPHITWLKDGRTIDLNKDGRVTMIGGGHLQILSLKSGDDADSDSESDSATYMCRAENDIDSADAEAQLTVLIPPQFKSQPPRNVTAHEKRDLTLECHAEGFPTPSVQWFVNGAPVVETDYLEIVEEQNLKIYGLLVQDSGFYQCFAENEAGNIQATMDLQVLKQDSINPFNPSTPSINYHVHRSGVYNAQNPNEVPTKPVNLTAAYISTRFVTLSWGVPERIGLSEIVAYAIQWQEVGSERERVTNTTTREANIQKLKPNTEYEFRVTAINKYGASFVPAYLKLKTEEEDDVPTIPESFQAFPLSAKSIKITWKPPAETRGPIRNYLLYYYTPAAKETEVQIDKGLTSYMMNDLEEYTLYTFRLVAVNDNGEGVSTDEVTARTFSDQPSDVPMNFTLETASSSSIVVRWQPPMPVHQNGKITGYKIRFKKKGVKKGLTVTTAGDRDLYALTDLRKGTTYQVRISAQTINGTGPPTDWEFADTYIDDLDESMVPDIPEKLLVRPTTNSLIVQWVPNRKSKVLVRGYYLGYGKGIPDVYRQVFDANQYSFVIEDLQPKMEYVVSIRAYNNKGQGQARYETRFTLEETAGEPVTPMLPPIGLKAIVLSANTIVLTWTDNSLGKIQRITDSRFYTIRYNSIPMGRSKYKYLNCTDLNRHIDDLKPDTLYEFAVKVTKGRRKSTWSMSVTNKTQEAAPGSMPRDLTPVPVEGDPLSVTLNWQPPAKPNGKITGYLVFYTTDPHQDDHLWVVEGVIGEKLSMTITDLTEDTTYHFKVQARNNKGYGPMSSEEMYKTPRMKRGYKPPGGGGGGAMGGSNPVVGVEDGTGVYPDYPEESEGKEEEKGLSQNVMIIIVACVVGTTFCIVVAVVTIFLCRRCDMMERNRRMASMYKGSPQKGKSPKGYGPPRPEGHQPPDLWIDHDHLELKGLGKDERAESSISVASTMRRNSHDSSSIHTNNPAEIYQSGSEAEERLLPPSYHQLNQTAQQQQQQRNVIRPKPLKIPVDAQSHVREPVATVAAYPNGHLMQKYAPSNRAPSPSEDSGVIPMRPVYPRTQYQMQYATQGPPRVNAGDLSSTSMHAGFPTEIGYRLVPCIEEDVHCHPEALDDSYMNKVGYGLFSAPSHHGSLTRRGKHPHRAPITGIASPVKAVPSTEVLPIIHTGSLGRPSHPLRSFSVPEPPGSRSTPTTPKHIVKPQQTAAPYKKSPAPISSGPIKPRSMVPQMLSPKSAPDVLKTGKEAEKDLQKSLSTEELTAEMANLEGLMKDLNAITQQDFEC